MAYWIGLVAFDTDLTILKNKFVKGEINQSIGSIISKEFEDDHVHIGCIYGSATYLNGKGHGVIMGSPKLDIDVPVGVAYGMGIRYFYVYMEKEANQKC